MDYPAQQNFSDDQMFSRRGDIEEKESFHIENAQMDQMNDNGESKLDMSANDANEIALAPANNEGPTQATSSAEKPKRLSKGAMKRYRALLAKGVSEEEAKIQSLIIPPQQVAKAKSKLVPSGAPKRLDNSRMDNRKRPLDARFSSYNQRQSFVRPLKSLMDSTPPFQSPARYPIPGPRVSYGRMSDQSIVFRRQFNEAPIKGDPKQIRVGLLPINFPIELLTNDRMKVIEDQILQKIVLQKNSVIKPGFLQSAHRIGYLYFVCKDRATVHWLKNLYNWSVENLQVVDTTACPTTNCMEATFPNSAEMSTSAVFDMIEGQNHGLYPQRWQVMSEVVSGSALHLIIAMDNMSLETLEKEKFKLFYRFSSVRLEHCMGSERDLMQSHKRFAQTNGGLTQFQGRESYNSGANDNGRDNVYSSDFLYNRY